METKTIKDYPYYEITEEGNVYRKARIGFYGNPIRRKLLKPYKGRNGYYAVYLHDGHGQRKMQYIHRLMYQAFIGEIPPKHEIDHIDGNRLNNSIQNLRAVSHKSNCNNPRSLENYRKANSLDKGKFNRNRMEAAKSVENKERLRREYKSIMEEKGTVGVCEFMKKAHCNYYTALRIRGEMSENTRKMGES